MRKTVKGRARMFNNGSFWIDLPADTDIRDGESVTVCWDAPAPVHMCPVPEVEREWAVKFLGGRWLVRSKRYDMHPSPGDQVRFPARCCPDCSEKLP